jgi:cell wall-associated NlpC family hydrolase
MGVRDRIVEEARAMVGTRYLHQGRLPRSGDNLGGIDCCGVPIVIGNKLGLIDFDITDYSRQADYGKFFGYFEEVCDRVEIPRSGDIVTLNFEDNLHCGILVFEVDKIFFIHSSLKWGAVREHEKDRRWLDKCIGFYRFPGVE